MKTNGRRSDKVRGKGKERETYPEDRDEDGRTSSAEASYETRVRGKERELKDAIEREHDGDDEEERREIFRLAHNKSKLLRIVDRSHRFEIVCLLQIFYCSETTAERKRVLMSIWLALILPVADVSGN